MSATLDIKAIQTWLSPFEAADYLRIAHQTLANLRVKGGGPRFSRRGRIVRYRRADLDAWMASGK
jgi:excisionase family DNA binding protein